MCVLGDVHWLPGRNCLQRLLYTAAKLTLILSTRRPNHLLFLQSPSQSYNKIAERKSSFRYLGIQTITQGRCWSKDQPIAVSRISGWFSAIWSNQLLRTETNYRPILLNNGAPNIDLRCRNKRWDSENDKNIKSHSDEDLKKDIEPDNSL